MRLRVGAKVHRPVRRRQRGRAHRMSGSSANAHLRRLPNGLAAGGFAAVLLGILGYVWFASTPLPLGGPNVAFATLAVVLAALSLALAAWSSGNVAAIRQRVRDIVPVVAVATLLCLWALAVYLATDTLDAPRLAKMALGIGVLFAVFVCVDGVRRARAMVFVIIGAVLVSALCGFGVALVGDPFLSLWLRIANVPHEDLQEMLLFGRIAGLSAHVSVFGRQVVVAIPLALAALLCCDCAGRPWSRRAALAALFVVLMGLVTAMLTNATRSVMLSVCVVLLAIAVVALRSARARRRFLVFAPLAVLWLFFTLAGEPEDAESAGVGGVRGDIRELATGDAALREGDADVLGHVFVGNRPGLEYEVQLRERHPAGYGQPGSVTVRADEQGTFVLTWRKRPDVLVYQSRRRAEGQVDWQEWFSFEPSLRSASPAKDERFTLQDMVVGSDWRLNELGQRRIGYRVSGLEPGARFVVELKAEVIGDHADPVPLAATVGEDGAIVLTWRVPSEIGVLGYVYRLQRRGEGWGRWHEFEAFMTAIAPGEAALDLAVGSRSLGGSAKSARIGHEFAGFVPWFWYAVQVRRMDARGAVKVGEATVKPAEAGDFVLTWREQPADGETVGYRFRARKISDSEWSPWQDFAPSLSSKVSTLHLIPADGEVDVVMEGEGGMNFRRHTLTSLPVGLGHRAQFRARSIHGYGAETREIDVYPDDDGTWTFAWREIGTDAATNGYQFRLWWLAKNRWWPWQDFVPNAENTGRTKVVFAGRLDKRKQNVAAAQTTDLFGAVAKPATIAMRRLMDASSWTRIHELGTVLRYVRDHPFGTGVYAPQLSHVSDGLSDWLVEELLRLWPHNQGLHVLALFGWPGLALLVVFYVCVLRSVVRLVVYAWRAADSDLRFLVVAVVGAWTAYSINTMFIPTSPFVGGWSHFYLIGLLFSVERLVCRATSGGSPVCDVD